MYTLNVGQYSRAVCCTNSMYLNWLFVCPGSRVAHADTTRQPQEWRQTETSWTCRIWSKHWSVVIAWPNKWDRFLNKKLSWCWQTCTTHLEVSQSHQTWYHSIC